ncbi:MAG: hypothetical protein JWR69_1126 [Pedosphaera sp.]|nr:hypothetical protein [Pedosphaera sp.]
MADINKSRDRIKEPARTKRRRATPDALPEARSTETRTRSQIQTGQSVPRLHKPVPWPDIVPAGQWANYRAAIEAARNAGLRFMLGGGFGLAIYTGRWRNTKDIDFYILPRDRDPMIAALSNAGFVDYFDQRPYDPGWIYRSTREGIIVDIIWSMANRRAEVDEIWFERGQPVQIREESMQVIPPEELLWCKLYILQRDHFDWTDIFNLLYAAGVYLDWDHLLERLGPDTPLLHAALTVFSWLAPNRAREFPDKLRKQLGLPKPEKISEREHLRRVKLLDSRAWFASLQQEGEYLEV